MRPAAATAGGSGPSAPVGDSSTFNVRLARCIAGLIVCGFGIALIVWSDVGVAPWDVLHQGLSDHTGIGIGTIIVIVGFALLVLWIPLRVRPGIGTILNAILIGVTVNVAETLLPDVHNTAVRVAVMLVGVALMGAGSGLYISAGLGPGPRDGLMTGIAARGYSLRMVRTGIELAVLIAGWSIGGTVGIGTAVFALSIGPLTQFFLHRFDTRPTLAR